MLAIVMKVSVAALIFAIGLSATLDDVAYIWRRPALLARSLIAMYVVIPLVAVLMARTLDLPPRTEAALVVLAICAGAPLLPKKLLKLGGDPTYIFSLVVATSLLAVATVPLGIQILSEYIPADATTTPGDVASTIVRAFLLPLAAGMLLRMINPGIADRLSDRLLQLASASLGICAIALLVAAFPKVADVGLPSLLAFGVFTLAALLTGHWLGGPEPAGRTSLAVACATRHLGLALLVAATAQGPNTLGMVAAYLLGSTIVSIPYIMWRRKVLGAGEGDAAAAS